MDDVDSAFFAPEKDIIEKGGERPHLLVICGGKREVFLSPIFPEENPLIRIVEHDLESPLVFLLYTRIYFNHAIR